MSFVYSIQYNTADVIICPISHYYTIKCDNDERLNSNRNAAMEKAKSVAPISSSMSSQSPDLKGKKSNFQTSKQPSQAHPTQGSLLQSLSNEQSQLPNALTDRSNNKITLSSLKSSSTNKSGKENKSPLPKSSLPHAHICPKCKKQYQHKQNLHKHIKKTHNQDGNEINTIKCKEKECTFSCRYIKQLRQHLNDHHNFNIKTETLHFSTMQGLL